MPLNLKFSFFLLLLSTTLFSQKTSPKTATLLSVACPGLGQIYNKKYWKTPIIIAGIGGALYAYNFYNNQFLEYKNAYILRTDGDESTIDNHLNYTESNLITLQDYYRNQKDLSIIIGSIIYILNIVDAYVDAHLFEYNINDNLSLNFDPRFSPDNNTLKLFSIKIKFQG